MDRLIEFCLLAVVLLILLGVLGAGLTMGGLDCMNPNIPGTCAEIVAGH